MISRALKLFAALLLFAISPSALPAAIVSFAMDSTIQVGPLTPVQSSGLTFRSGIVDVYSTKSSAGGPDGRIDFSWTPSLNRMAFDVDAFGRDWWGGYAGELFRVTQYLEIENTTDSPIQIDRGTIFGTFSVDSVGHPARVTNPDQPEFAYAYWRWTFNQILGECWILNAFTTNLCLPYGEPYAPHSNTLLADSFVVDARGTYRVLTTIETSYSISIPEPHVLALLSLSFAGLAFGRRRQ